jgi:hypothetical protein
MMNRDERNRMDGMEMAIIGHRMKIAALTAERDAEAARVKELEAALREIADCGTIRHDNGHMETTYSAMIARGALAKGRT